MRGQPPPGNRAPIIHRRWPDLLGACVEKPNVWFRSKRLQSKKYAAQQASYIRINKLNCQQHIKIPKGAYWEADWDFELDPRVMMDFWYVYVRLVVPRKRGSSGRARRERKPSS